MSQDVLSMTGLMGIAAHPVPASLCLKEEEDKRPLAITLVVLEEDLSA